MRAIRKADQQREYNPRILLRRRGPLAGEVEHYVLSEAGWHTKYVNLKTGLCTAVVGRAAYDYFKSRHVKYPNNIAALNDSPVLNLPTYPKQRSRNRNAIRKDASCSDGCHGFSESDAHKDYKLTQSRNATDPEQSSLPCTFQKSERMFFPFSAVFQSSSTSSVSSVLQNPSVSSPVKYDGLAAECMDYCIALISYVEHYSFLKEYSHNHRVLYVIKDVGTRPNGTRILVDRLVFAGIVKCEFEDGTHLVSFCTACSHLPDETVATLLHQQRFPHTMSEQILGKGRHYGQCCHAQVTATLHTRETASNQQKSLLLQYFNRRDLPDPIDLRWVTRPLSTTVIFSRYRSHPINVFVHFGCGKFIGCYKDGRGYFRCLQCRRPPGKYCKHVSSITYTDEEIRCQSSSIVGGASVVSKDAPGIQ